MENKIFSIQTMGMLLATKKFNCTGTTSKLKCVCFWITRVQSLEEIKERDIDLLFAFFHILIKTFVWYITFVKKSFVKNNCLLCQLSEVTLSFRFYRMQSLISNVRTVPDISKKRANFSITGFSNLTAPLFTPFFQGFKTLNFQKYSILHEKGSLQKSGTLFV